MSLILLPILRNMDEITQTYVPVHTFLTFFQYNFL